MNCSWFHSLSSLSLPFSFSLAASAFHLFFINNLLITKVSSTLGACKCSMDFSLSLSLSSSGSSPSPCSVAGNCCKWHGLLPSCKLAKYSRKILLAMSFCVFRLAKTFISWSCHSDLGTLPHSLFPSLPLAHSCCLGLFSVWVCLECLAYFSYFNWQKFLCNWADGFLAKFTLLHTHTVQKHRASLT